MDFLSTRRDSSTTSLREAILRGPAPDGGLYMPREIPRFDAVTLAESGKGPWPAMAVEVIGALLKGALDAVTLNALTSDALSFPMPLVQLRERLYVLELFHGPTLAFKDVGARFMARLLAHFRQKTDPPVTVLTATSGDTGGAVAHAFHGTPGTRVVILFPDGKVTPRQERQFSTLGGNVEAVAVRGDFDACQRLAKEAFLEMARARASARSATLRPTRETVLTSANSINVARFLPQASYFFHPWALLKANKARSKATRTHILFSVPSGNFGNLAAGLLAKRMGLTGVSFLAATNINDVVPEYLRTGHFHPRASTPTLSTAMDVGDPSNLDRIYHLYDGDLARIREDLVGQRVTDQETMECIKRVFGEAGYVLDPHSAVGYAALERELQARRDLTGVLLATAHPAKFAEVVEPVLGQPLPIPPELEKCLQAERRVTPLEPRLDGLMEILCS